MFARVKKSGQYQYLQIVENNKVKGRVKQRVWRAEESRDGGRQKTVTLSS